MKQTGRQRPAKFSTFVSKRQTRKAKRKDERKLKKMRVHAFKQHKPLPTAESLERERRDAERLVQEKKKKAEAKRQRKLRRKEERQKKVEVVDEKKSSLLEENARDERMLRQLEKNLGMKKRNKSKKPSNSLPAAFVRDGLDFLLDVVDPVKMKSFTEDIEPGAVWTQNESGSDQELSDAEIAMDTSEAGDSDERSSEGDEELGSEEEGLEEEEGSEEEQSGSGEELEGDDDDLDDVEPSDETDSDDDKIPSKNPNEAKKKRLQALQEMVKSSGKDADGSTPRNMKQPGQKVDTDDAKKQRLKALEEMVKNEMVPGSVPSGVYVPPGKRQQLATETSGGSSGKTSGKDGELSSKSILKRQDSETDDKKAKRVKFAAEDENQGQGHDSKTSPVLREDIYGRLRDVHGNVVEPTRSTAQGSVPSGVYVPPGKRQQLATETSGGTKPDETDVQRRQRLQLLTRQIKGQINRLSESNMASVCKLIESLYSSNPRADVTESLTSVVLDSLLLQSLAPLRVSTDSAMLLALVHCRVGSEVTASFLQQLVNRFSRLFDSAVAQSSDKQIDNAVMLLTHLYSFKVISCQLIFDVMKMLTRRFNERDIELLLSLVKGAGFGLRKDDPSTFKDLLVDMQTKSTTVNVTSFTDPSRVKFLLETLVAVKNNNVHKLQDADQQQHLQHLQKVLKMLVKGSSDCALNVSLDDLLNAGDYGKWFLVGSAWHGGKTKELATDGDVGPAGVGESAVAGLSTDVVVSDKLAELGHKLGMNTELRRTAFYTIMTCEDYVDAFEKLLKLISKQQQRQREVIHILFKLCLHERTFNAFYACLLDKLCHYHRQYQVTVQFTVRDHLSTVAELAAHKLQNLADLIVHLVASSALSLAVFKDVDFAELNKPTKRLLERVLHSLIVDQPEKITEKCFRRIASGAHLELLRDGLRLFLLHFLKRSKGQGDTDDDVRQNVEQRLKLAEQAMLTAV